VGDLGGGVHFTFADICLAVIAIGMIVLVVWGENAV
jgi:hypothetical protein